MPESASRPLPPAEAISRYRDALLRDAAPEELARETVTASAGGGAVKATMSGNLELVELQIDPEVLNPEDVEMLQDMVLAAVNEALTSSQEMASKRLGGITGGLGDLGLNLPGM